ncbi:hypothetical protein DI43_02120 [Geobacillus sp. CAMR12739]|nr:hypothetical protein DI43_02120 [Geobacillus sp. CAMR12739]
MMKMICPFFSNFATNWQFALKMPVFIMKYLPVKNEWEETFRAVSEMIFLIDLEGNVLRYNDAANEVFSR